MMKSLLVLVLLVGLALGRPQNPDDNNRRRQQRPGGGGGNLVFATTAAPNTPTTAASNASTTASPQYLACLQSCPSTMEYNPICGSDSINYHNNGRLTCAQRCGKNVAAVRAGTCMPL